MGVNRLMCTWPGYQASSIPTWTCFRSENVFVTCSCCVFFAVVFVFQATTRVHPCTLGYMTVVHLGGTFHPPTHHGTNIYGIYVMQYDTYLLTWGGMICSYSNTIVGIEKPLVMNMVCMPIGNL